MAGSAGAAAAESGMARELLAVCAVFGDVPHLHIVYGGIACHSMLYHAIHAVQCLHAYSSQAGCAFTAEPSSRSRFLS